MTITLTPTMTMTLMAGLLHPVLEKIINNGDQAVG